MKLEQAVKHETPMKTDFLAWRVGSAKKRYIETKRNRAYNLRPRLRSEAHH